MSSTDLKTYHGNCHCGAYKFTIDVPELKEATICNCSMCARKGYLYVQCKPADFHLERGEGVMKKYTFGTGKWPHEFCPTCGSTCVMRDIEKNDKLYINANVLNDVDLWSLKINQMDGSSWGDEYKLQPPAKTPTAGGDDLKTYSGQCHCGKVKFTFKSKPLEQERVSVCNCSICKRDAYLFHYSPHELVNFEGLENTTVYQGVGSKMAEHRFCSTCSVPITITTSGEIPKEIFDTFDKDLQDRIMKAPINLRCIEKLDTGKLDILKETEGTDGYVVA